MSVLISGILRDGAGKPVQGCTIHLKARRTSPTVVVKVTSSTLTGADGHYSIEAEPGYYSVSLLREGFPPSVAGDIYIAPTDEADTLNAFLDAPKDADLRPEVMKRFEEMVNRVVDLSGATEKDRERAEQAAQSAEQSNEAAALSATGAAESQRQAARSADAADVSARSADDNARQTAQDVLDSGANADDAAKSAQSSQDDASRAEQGAKASEHAAGDSARYAESARLSAADADQSRQDAGQSALSAHESERAAAAALDDSARNAVRAENAATEGERSATAAAQSKQAASTSADNAATSERSAGTSAGESAQSAKESAESARHAGQHKDAAALSEANAKDSEDAAAKSASDAVGVLAGALLTENNLSEFAGAGDDVVAEIHKNLHLGAAAKSGVQKDIYDRTEGCLALPGSFGYGGYHHVTHYFSAVNGPEEFRAWVKKTPPGRYIVTQYGNPVGIYNPIIQGVVFQGTLDLSIPTATVPEEQSLKDKFIEFRGANGDVWVNRLYQPGDAGGRLIEWIKLNFKLSDSTYGLRATTGNAWGSPGVGGIILAAYCGKTDEDDNRTLRRGGSIPGSRLSPVTLSATYNSAGSYQSSATAVINSANQYPQVGTFVALSGVDNTVVATDKALIGLFIRIA
ncbi:prophage tail fiber N-terminal domain-containing protein [Citrobacter sp. Cpo113]|uniref:prophage tail fiber N-terminal domain-containing protein n=1 Tax=Citrobacter sp. Cpo113 TaxID=2985146 RepID=UPI0025772168|nr:prophage tail fiber N-terminal domain-containing protein [Citrobacter sp. Cpo113]MDM2789423.1 prophage tail fiber N-terminal domain-containing protein [Citrobacter sp. Cpo113]